MTAAIGLVVMVAAHIAAVMLAVQAALPAAAVKAVSEADCDLVARDVEAFTARLGEIGVEIEVLLEKPERSTTTSSRVLVSIAPPQCKSMGVIREFGLAMFQRSLASPLPSTPIATRPRRRTSSQAAVARSGRKVLMRRPRATRRRRRVRRRFSRMWLRLWPCSLRPWCRRSRRRPRCAPSSARPARCPRASAVSAAAPSTGRMLFDRRSLGGHRPSSMLLPRRRPPTRPLQLHLHL